MKKINPFSTRFRTKGVRDETNQWKPPFTSALPPGHMLLQMKWTNSCLDKSRPTPVSWLLLSSLSAALREVHLPGSLHQLSQHHPVFWPPWQQLGHAVSKGWVRNSACCVSLWLPQGSIFSLVKIKHRIYHIFLQSGLANMSRDCGKKSSLFLSKTLKIIYLFIYLFILSLLLHITVCIHPVQYACSNASNNFERCEVFSKHFIKLSSPVQPVYENGRSGMVDSAVYRSNSCKNINRWSKVSQRSDALFKQTEILHAEQ